VNYNQKQELEMKKFLRFLKDKSGATAIEYGLIVAFLSLVIVAGATVASPALKSIWDGLGVTMVAAEKAS
jgi:pilus assembly protein Flp/PilA